MVKKQLRTVKKSNQTGRLDRGAVRSEVILVRDGRSGQNATGPKLAAVTQGKPGTSTKPVPPLGDFEGSGFLD
jgi:hypothetical protein